MRPKTECCIRAIAQGVKAAHIIDGRIGIHYFEISPIQEKGQ